ncbi:MAG: hypothetical protein KC910_05365 [Candidatus Eremiobacteraeota bacterium]|nr:hypothetical protein [Candidatus Eremiobacteraeota bacterium]
MRAATLLSLPLLLYACQFMLRHLAKERDPWLLLFGSLGLSVPVLTLWGALTMPLVSIQVSLMLLACVGGGLLVARERWPGPEIDNWRAGKNCVLLALPGAALTAFFALFLKSVSFTVEDGFFIHSSIVGMAMKGIYPPVVFGGDLYLGHYGKDLLVALLASATHLNFLDMEWLCTVVIAVVHFMFLACWLRVESGSTGGALLATYLAFFGSGMASHIGLADTVANNNAVVYLTLSVCSYLLLRWLRQGETGQLLLAAPVLGVEALMYETHFGLLVLALVTLAVVTRVRPGPVVLLISMALLMACVEGGVITNLARKAVAGPPKQSPGWESADLSIQIPKHDLFCLRRDNLRPCRFFETPLRPFQADFTPSRQMTPLWNRELLSTVWLPVWFAPLLLVLLMKWPDYGGGWFFSIGAYALLTPAVIGFGYWDSETARWLFCAAVAFSIAWGLGCARALGGQPRARRLLVLALLGAFLTLPTLVLELKEMTNVLAHPGTPRPDGSPGVVPGGGLIPNAQRSLAYHHHFLADDLLVARVLARLASPGQRLLANYPDQAPSASRNEIAADGVINRIGLQAGLTGLLPTGLSVAPRNRWCAPLYTPTLQVRAFWADPQPWRLADLQADWLLVDESLLYGNAVIALTQLEGLEQRFAIPGRRIYQVTSRDNAPATGELDQLEWQGSMPENLQARKPFRVFLAARRARQGEVEVEFRYLALEADPPLEANPDDLLKARLGLGEQLEAMLVGPIYPGRYRLQWRLDQDSPWRTLRDLDFH